MKLLSNLRHYPLLLAGLMIILVLVLFGPVGRLFVDTDGAKVGAAMPELSPSADYPLGTDTVGREILAVMVIGTPLTLRIGLIAGSIGLGLGILFGFLAGYFGGWVDTLIKGLSKPQPLVLGHNADHQSRPDHCARTHLGRQEPAGIHQF